MRQLRKTLLLAGAIGTMLAALVGVLLASGMSRRLRRAAVVADRVTAGDHSARIEAAGGDEIARLGHAVDQMSDALATRLAREQRFTGDVAHELRTPLTGLTSAAELLDDSRPAQIVRERVGALRSLVAELLELAQLDADEDGAMTPAPQPLALAPWLREFAAAHPSAPALEFERPAVVLADRRRLERIVGNLLDNAMRHGRPPIVVRVTGALIEVRDDGPVSPPSCCATVRSAFGRQGRSRRRQRPRARDRRRERGTRRRRAALRQPAGRRRRRVAGTARHRPPSPSISHPSRPDERARVGDATGVVDEVPLVAGGEHACARNRSGARGLNVTRRRAVAGSR